MQAMGFRGGEALGPRSRPQTQRAADPQLQEQPQPQTQPTGGLAGARDSSGDDNDGTEDSVKHGNGRLHAPAIGNADADVDAAAVADAGTARRTEPLALNIKEDRGGIGLDAERKRKLREEFAHESKRQRADEGEYRERVRAEREEQRLERLVLGAMKVAERLNADTDEDADADAGADMDMGTEVSTAAGRDGAEAGTQKTRTAASQVETTTLGRVAGSRANSAVDMGRRPLVDGDARSGGYGRDDGEAAGEGSADGGNVAEQDNSADTASATVVPIVIAASAVVDDDGNSSSAEQRASARRDAAAAAAAAAAPKSEPKAKPKAQLPPPLKSINVLWRGLVRHRVEKERERRMRYDLQQSLSRLPTYTDTHESADDQRALERAAQGAEEELEEEDPELDAFSVRPSAERLQLLVDYLRRRHRYCFWCKYKYPDDRLEGCPGVTEEDHD